MRNLLIFLYFVFLVLNTSENTQAQTNTDSVKISILTCSPGLELYSLFGHSAIRVQDPSKKLDIVFNYGIFDFNTPNFYPKFVRGKLKYNLGVNDFKGFYGFKAAYKRHKQSVVEQELNLSSKSKHKLLKALEENYRPENRYYLYDFIFKNCSTLIRDILEEDIVDQVQYKDAELTSDLSFRDQLNIYMEKTPWIYTGINLALGYAVDKKATHYQKMFLPDFLKSGFDNTLITENGISHKLVSKENIILSSKAKQKPTPWYLHPLFIFGLIAFIGLLLTLSSLKSNKRFAFFDILVFGCTSLFGFVLLFLWFFTDHLSMRPNFNILWALPIHLPLITVLFRKNRPVWVKNYFKYHSIFILLVIAAWPILPQSLPYTILPFVVLILIRSIYNARRS